MTSPRSSRRTPRTKVGKLIRHWPKIRLAIRTARLILRMRLALQTALLGLAVAGIARIVRRRRRSADGASVTSYAPPPVRRTAPSPSTPVNGRMPTETERTLNATK